MKLLFLLSSWATSSLDNFSDIVQPSSLMHCLQCSHYLPKFLPVPLLTEMSESSRRLSSRSDLLESRMVQDGRSAKTLFKVSSLSEMLDSEKQSFLFFFTGARDGSKLPFFLLVLCEGDGSESSILNFSFLLSEMLDTEKLSFLFFFGGEREGSKFQFCVVSGQLTRTFTVLVS